MENVPVEVIYIFIKTSTLAFVNKETDGIGN